jgi:MFS family permease
VASRRTRKLPGAASAAADNAARVTTSLRPLAATFVVFGTFAGAWAVAAVDVERAFDLTDAELGFLLAAGILTATGVAAFGGAISDRIGARRALTLSLLIWGALVAAEAASPRVAVFAPLFIAALAVGGLLDVVMNVIAADALASEPGRLVRFHGIWNFGAVIGAIATGVALRFDASWRVVWIAIACVVLAAGSWVRRGAVPEPVRAEHPSMWRALIGLRHEGLVVLALVFGASALVEGGVSTWGVLYLRSHLGVGVLAGVGAYVAGASLATATRMGGGPLLGALGTRRAVMIGAGLACTGMALEALSANAGIAACGLALASVGITVVWPLLLADVNNEARHPALAIGGVTASGYLGMVAGPAIVGLLASLLGLRAGLVLLAAVALFVAITPAHVRPSKMLKRAG